MRTSPTSRPPPLRHVLVLCLFPMLLPAMHVTPCHTTGALYAPKLRLVRVEHEPSTIQTAQDLRIKLFGISNERIDKLGKFHVHVFFCRRYQDCMSVYDFTGSLCDLLTTTAEGDAGGRETSTYGSTSSGSQGAAAGDSEQGSSLLAAPTSSGMGSEGSSTSQPKDCSLDFFEPFALEFTRSEPIPVDVFRGTYDLQIFLEDSCFWVEDVTITAGETFTALGDYRDVILAFIVASSSSFVLGQYINPATYGLLPEITGFLLMGIVLGPFGTNLLSRFAVYLIQRDLNRICLSFIAITAGLEVYLPKMQGKVGKTVLVLVFSMTIFTVLIVGLGGWLLHLFPYSPYDSTKPPGMLACMLMGAIMVARSPTTLFAICNQLKLFDPLEFERERLRIVLVTAIASDLAVLFVFSMVCSIIRVAMAHEVSLANGREDGASGSGSGGESGEKEAGSSSAGSSSSANKHKDVEVAEVASPPPEEVQEEVEEETTASSTEAPGRGDSTASSKSGRKKKQTPIIEQSNSGTTEKQVKSKEQKDAKLRRSEKHSGKSSSGGESGDASTSSSMSLLSLQQEAAGSGKVLQVEQPTRTAAGPSESGTGVEMSFFSNLLPFHNTRAPPPKPVKNFRLPKPHKWTTKDFGQASLHLCRDLTITIGGSVLIGVVFGFLFRKMYRVLLFRTTSSGSELRKTVSKARRSSKVKGTTTSTGAGALVQKGDEKGTRNGESETNHPESSRPTRERKEQDRALLAIASSEEEGQEEEDFDATNLTIFPPITQLDFREDHDELLYKRIAGKLQRQEAPGSDTTGAGEPAGEYDRARLTALSQHFTEEERARLEANLGAFLSQQPQAPTSREGSLMADPTTAFNDDTAQIGNLRATFRRDSLTNSETAGQQASQNRWLYPRASSFFLFVVAVFEICDRGSAATEGVLRLEPLLICSILACVVGHDPEIRAEVAEVITTFTPHVFLPFFTVTGASLRLLVMASLLDTALVVFALRTVAILVACNLGVAVSEATFFYGNSGTTNGYSNLNEAGAFLNNGGQAGPAAAGNNVRNNNSDPKLRQYLGFTMLSQAGVSLGLALETVAIFPNWGQEVCDVVIAVVCVNQVIGPIFAVYGFKKMQEKRSNGSSRDHRTNHAGNGGVVFSGASVITTHTDDGRHTVTPVAVQPTAATIAAPMGNTNKTKEPSASRSPPEPN
ncbi:unnamed protein product [Amoebophrya sp. A120]|nr:unnamed protein product [Amoebophrya sp. A120]|eukprot:GSA120T00025396001.1